MTTTTDDQQALLDASDYDLEGTPTLNGRKATTVTVTVEPFELDTSDAQHMQLAGRIKEGGTFSITMTARVTKRSWVERENLDTVEIGRRYVLSLRDITT